MQQETLSICVMHSCLDNIKAVATYYTSTKVQGASALHSALLIQDVKKSASLPLLLQCEVVTKEKGLDI